MTSCKLCQSCRWGYLSELPSREYLPMFWTADELDLLKGTVVALSVLVRCTSLLLPGPNAVASILHEQVPCPMPAAASPMSQADMAVQSLNQVCGYVGGLATHSGGL